MDLSKLTHLSDFTIILPNKSYKVHKVILSKCEYFNKLFQSNMIEARTNELNLSNTESVFDIFIDVIYNNTHISSKDETIIGELLDLCFYFGFEEGIKQLALLVVNSKHIYIELVLKYTQLLDMVDLNILYRRYNNNLRDVDNIISSISEVRIVSKFISFLAYKSIEEVTELIDNWIKIHNKSELWTCLDDMHLAITPYSISKLYEGGYLNIPQIVKKISGIGSLCCKFTHSVSSSFKIKWNKYGGHHLITKESNNRSSDCYQLSDKEEDICGHNIYLTVDKYNRLIINANSLSNSEIFVITSQGNLLFQGNRSLFKQGEYNTNILMSCYVDYKIVFYSNEE